MGGQPRKARALFVAGVPRSGTSALVGYLNRHPQILVCLERYKYLPAQEIKPELFTFERILDYRPGETNIRREVHVELLAQKSPNRLGFVGDKSPAYVKSMPLLARNNPGARFLVTYRPVEEVAESFEARANNPRDRWPSHRGFVVGITAWRRALRHTRRFIERSHTDRVFIVDYRRFFTDPESLAASLGEFLGVDFDSEIRAEWARMSAEHEQRRREKEPLSDAHRELVESWKGRETERWIIDRIARQEDRPRRGPAFGWWHALVERASNRVVTSPRDSQRRLRAGRKT